MAWILDVSSTDTSMLVDLLQLFEEQTVKNAKLKC